MRTARVLIPLPTTGALVCRYWGLDDRGHQAGTLAQSRTVRGGRRVRSLAARLDALPQFPTTAIACPADFDREDVVFFHYVHGSDDPVRIDGSGCMPVSNGRLEKLGLGLPLGHAHWVDEALL
jgi:hypothetical protein